MFICKGDTQQVSHLIGVLCGEVLHGGDDALGDELTIGGRGLLLDELRLLAADWSKHAAQEQTPPQKNREQGVSGGSHVQCNTLSRRNPIQRI